MDLTAVEREARVKAEASLRAVVAELGDDVTVEVDAFVGDPPTSSSTCRNASICSSAVLVAMGPFVR